METIDAVLRDVPVFAGLAPEQLSLLAGCGSNVRFAEGEVLFREGDRADMFWVVRHGSVFHARRGAAGADDDAALFHGPTPQDRRGGFR